MRAINSDGDAVDMLAACDTFGQARQYIPDLIGETVAWVIERHTDYFTRGKPDAFKVLDTGGDISALQAGGWISEEAAS